MDYSKVGSFIRQKRMDQNLTQQSLADDLFVDVTTVSKWERGITFPDSGLITRLCAILKINEHELFAACEDQDYRNAKRKLNDINKGKKIAFWIITGCYLTAILTCFICNLAVNKTLSWFWIVLTGCLTGWTFFPTSLRFFKKYLLEAYIGTTFLSLTLLFLTCSIYSDNYWCFIAILGTLLGYFLFFFPFVVYKKDYLKKIRNFFLLIYSFVTYALVISLLFIVNLYTNFDIKTALIITSYCFAPVVICGGIAAISLLNKLTRASFIVLVSGAFCFGLNGVLNGLLDPSKTDIYKIDFVDWNSCSNGNVALILGIATVITFLILLIASLLRKKD